MQVDDQLMTYLESMSRLELSDIEKQNLKDDLTRILNYIDKLNELDTENVEEVSHPFIAKGVLRDDQVEPSFDIELILSNGPRTRSGCFIVPNIQT